MSYYSQHAYHMGVLPPGNARDLHEPAHSDKSLPVCDVYFAELELP